MVEQYQLEIDQLAVGLTKPATIRGVPLVGFYLSIFLCLIGCMYYQAFAGAVNLKAFALFLVLWLVIYAFMFYHTYHDPYGLSVAWLNLTKFRKHQSHSFWNNMDSYTS